MTDNKKKPNRITFDMDDENTLTRLQTIAREQNRSVGAQIRQIIKEWLEKQPKVSK